MLVVLQVASLVPVEPMQTGTTEALSLLIIS